MDWQKFENWVGQGHKPYVTSTIVNYAVRYADCLFKHDLSLLHDMNDSKRRYVSTALSSLARFLGIYKDFRELVENYGIKWSGKSYTELLIQRFQREMDQSLWTWALTVKQLVPRLGFYVDFIALTRMRLNEATESYRLIKKLNAQGKLNEYHDQEKMVLEHYKFPDLFLRKIKNTFVSFLKPDFIFQLAENSQERSIPKRLSTFADENI